MISIIVPVYNAEGFLRRTLDSILGQTYREFELILVDDGSTDGSGEICREYAAKDPRIRVIRQENQGPSEARNLGTKLAAGDYVTYVDSDDLLAESYLEKLLHLAERFRAELAICEIAILGEGETLVVPEGTEFRERCVSGEEALEEMLLGRIHGSSACGLLLRADLAKKHLFPAGKYHEDDCISFRYFADAERVALTMEPLYGYVQRAGSIMHSGYGKISTDELDAGDYLAEACREMEPAIASAAVYKRFTNYCQVLRENPDLKEKDPEVWWRIRAGLRDMKGKIATDRRFERQYRRYAWCLCLGGTELLRRLFQRAYRRQG